MTVRRTRLEITDGSAAPRVGDLIREGVSGVVIGVSVVEVDGAMRAFEVLVAPLSPRPQRRARRRRR